MARNLGQKCQNAFSLGIRAFYRGFIDSPFSPSTMMHREWLRGFNTSYRKHQERISGNARKCEV